MVNNMKINDTFVDVITALLVLLSIFVAICIKVYYE